MILKELKDWINDLPDKFLEYDVVNGEVGLIDNEYHYRIYKSITTLTANEDSKEIIFLNEK